MRGYYALPQEVFTIQRPDGSILVDYMCHEEGVCERLFGVANLKEKQYEVIKIKISKITETADVVCECDSQTRIGTTKLWCCNQCGLRTESF